MATLRLISALSQHGGQALTAQAAAGCSRRSRPLGSVASARAFAAGANRAPLLPERIVKDPRIKAALPSLGNVSYGALASGFLMTDILHLRAAVAGAYCGITTFHALQERPLRIPFAWSALFAAINLMAAAMLMRERFVWLSEEEERVYSEHFVDAMAKHEFLRLMEHAEISTATERADVVRKGEVAGLVLILDGRAEVSLSDGLVVNITRSGLLGESSFIRGTVATKTVSVAPGCRYVFWQRDELKELFETNHSVRRGLELVIGRELARKLQNTTSLLLSATSGAKDIAAHQQDLHYEAVVLRYALRLLGSEGWDEKSAHCQRLFEELAAYRRTDEIPDEVHERVMKRIGVDEESCLREGTTLRFVCRKIASSPIPQARVRVE